MRIFGRTYPFVAPNIRDPRLHLAAVIISIHFLGQIALGFRVSVPQILVAILVVRRHRGGMDPLQDGHTGLAGERDADRQRRRADPAR